MFPVVMPINIINLLADVMAWCAIIFLTNFIYKKQEQKPKVWKVILIMVIGLFSFNIDFNFGFKLPILPLGVWILYWYFHNKGDRWQVYRKFAWLGFGANFIFLIFSLIQNPIHHVVYPPNQLSTYISNTEDASIIATHPFAKSMTLDKKQLLNQVPTTTLEEVNAQEWYDEIIIPSSEQTTERFPYILNGIQPKWGSGMGALIYLEKDGQGLLVTTSGKQLYFRLKNSVLKENH